MIYDDEKLECLECGDEISYARRGAIVCDECLEKYPNKYGRCQVCGFIIKADEGEFPSTFCTDCAYDLFTNEDDKEEWGGLK